MLVCSVTDVARASLPSSPQQKDIRALHESMRRGGDMGAGGEEMLALHEAVTAARAPIPGLVTFELHPRGDKLFMLMPRYGASLEHLIHAHAGCRAQSKVPRLPRRRTRR